MLIKLKPEEAQKVLDAINSNGPLVCPMCHKSKGFIFDPNGTQLLALNTLEMAHVTKTVDQLPVITGYCKHCGYIVQFNLQHFDVDL